MQTRPKILYGMAEIYLSGWNYCSFEACALDFFQSGDQI